MESRNVRFETRETKLAGWAEEELSDLLPPRLVGHKRAWGLQRRAALAEQFYRTHARILLPGHGQIHRTFGIPLGTSEILSCISADGCISPMQSTH